MKNNITALALIGALGSFWHFLYKICKMNVMVGLYDGQFYEAVADSAYSAARDALNGVDPTGGAIYYYNPQTATNTWIRSRKILTTIGKHVFCE